METIQINIAYKIISMIISSVIGYIVVFKVMKSNPLRVVSNTFKKKILSAVIVTIASVLISYFIEGSNINNYRIYSGIVSGIFITVFARVISTESEAEKALEKEEI